MLCAWLLTRASRSCELKKKVVELVYEAQKAGASKQVALKITFKSLNESSTAHDILRRAIDERATTTDTTNIASSGGGGASATAAAAADGGRLPPVSPRTGPLAQRQRKGTTTPSTGLDAQRGVTLRNKDKSAANVIVSMLEACPTRVLAGGTAFQRDLESTGADISPCLYVVQGVATVNCVAAMAVGDLVLYTLNPGSMYAPDATFFGLTDDAKIKWVCDANSQQVVAKEVSASMLAESKPELACTCLRWLAQEQEREMLSYLSAINL